MTRYLVFVGKMAGAGVLAASAEFFAGLAPPGGSCAVTAHDDRARDEQPAPTGDCACCEASSRLCEGLVARGSSRCCTECQHEQPAPTAREIPADELEGGVPMVHWDDLPRALDAGLLGAPDPLCGECGAPIVANTAGSGGATWCHTEVPVGNGHRARPAPREIPADEQRAADELAALSQELGLYDDQPAPTVREIPAAARRLSLQESMSLIRERYSDAIAALGEEREIPADELAQAVQHLREVLGMCKRTPGGHPQSLTDHATEIVLGGLDELARERDAARAELERLRRRVDELRPMAAHGVRNPPEVIEEMAAELERLRARVAELEPIEERALRVLAGDARGHGTSGAFRAASYIVGGA